MIKHLVVIDTNVLVSALLSKHSDTSTVKVLDLLYSAKIIPLYNDEIIKEYKDVLYREKFNFDRTVIFNLLQSINSNGIPTKRLKTNKDFVDPKDIVFYEVCMNKQDEDAMLVTGNLKHFPKERFIVTPKELIEIINGK